MNDRYRLIANVGTLTLPVQFERGLPEQPIKILHDVWLHFEHDKIKAIGAADEPFPEGVNSDEVFDAKGMLATPGLIDCHTHPVFVGTRQNEFVRRNRGESYQQIAAAGGGIVSSLRGVRSSTVDELATVFRKHLNRFLELGVTTLEAKSGYGLSFADELKMLRAIKAGSEGHPVEVTPTLLAAHVVPPEFKENPDRYVDIVCQEIIPAVAEEKLSDSVDVFMEHGAYSTEQTRRVFAAGKAYGLQLRLHADQFTDSGGAEMAKEFSALTVDHMDRTPEAKFGLLAESGATVVMLPGAVFFLGLDHYASGRKFIDAGCKVALSTDFNPGTTPTKSLPLMMTIACIKMGFSPAEALWAVTMGGANGTARADRVGGLDVGYQADVCLWDAEDIDFIPYNYGDMIPEVVFKKGVMVASRGCRIDSDDDKDSLKQWESSV